MDKIEHLANLSKLSFTDLEKQQFEKEFSKIVSFVDEIKKINLPTTKQDENDVSLQDLRQDTANQSLTRADILANAPKQKDGCFVTPLVVE